MDVRFVNPVLESLMNVLNTMASMQPQVGKLCLKSDCNARGVVSSIIDMVGKQATGTIAISFSSEAALDLSKRMLRMELTKVDDMVRDLVGEMANMVAGGAKAKLAEKGYDFELTLPKIISGEGHYVKHRFDGPVLLLPFTSEGGEFFVEICLRNATEH